MGSNFGPIGTLLIVLAGITAFVLLMVFVAVPLFKGIGWGITGVFRLIGWFFTHIFQFIAGMCRDTVRFVGAIIAFILLSPVVPLSVVFGRWSAAGHYAEAVKREAHVAAACIYRVLLKHPLTLLMLDGLLEGLEQRVPEAMAAAPGADKPGKRIGQFDGYTITGSLRAGGSGAKLYIAEPDSQKRARIRDMPDRVVIKCFALAEGSGLPQIVRESRALECAKQLGHVLDHGMDEHRFFYVMPYHAGDHLGIVTRQAHGESGGKGLDSPRLRAMLAYGRDLIATLTAYHRGGLWHKDVKPENVIVHDGRAHLVDLGLMTSLRSAMTLTTHGTEYFRDPEMVRQALRGVKVHQVNGAKFDIYAAGAVLYFQLENTFPAHGGLSRFSLPSPEALRWIVRRAMTEYTQRYDSADDMLADLDHVVSAHDPFAVKPVELPSMRASSLSAAAAGGHPSFASPATAAAVAAMGAMGAGAAAAAPQAVEAFKGFGLVAGVGDHGSFAQVGRISLDERGNPIPPPLPAAAGSPPRTRRPKLSITNWWTGRYSVEDPGDPDGPSGGSDAPAPAPSPGTVNDAAFYRRQAAAFRDQARHPGSGMGNARRAAHEQIKAARQRAADIRSRVRSHRHAQWTQPRSSSRVVGGVIAVLSVLFLCVILYFTFNTTSIWQNTSHSSSPDVTTETWSAADKTHHSGPALLVVASDEALDRGALTDPDVNQSFDHYRQQGYTVVIDEPQASVHLAPLMKQWVADPDGPADGVIEDLFETFNTYGVLYITHRPSDPAAVVTLVRSSRDGADQRTGPLSASTVGPDGVTVADPSITRASQASIAMSPGLPLLLINDHPAKIDPAVEQRIARIMKEYAQRGWQVVVNDDAEADARTVLAPGAELVHDSPAWTQLGAILQRHGLGGILRIAAGPGDAPPAERILATRLMPPAPAPQSPDPAMQVAAPSFPGDPVTAIPPAQPVGTP